MPANYLVTGRPRIGKTTVVQKVVSRLEDKGHRPGGVYCPEIRKDGRRRGFEIVDLTTGRREILAHVEGDGPSVGKYHVRVSNVDEITKMAFGRALKEADFVVVDEIAPMETYSEAFVDGVRDALDSPKPLLGVVHEKSSSGFVEEVKRRSDTEIFEVTEENRNELPEKLSHLVESSI